MRAATLAALRGHLAAGRQLLTYLQGRVWHAAWVGTGEYEPAGCGVDFEEAVLDLLVRTPGSDRSSFGRDR